MGADRRADSGAMAWPWALLAHAGAAHTLRYTGGLMGVRADVTLYTTHARAAIRLRGIPVGGVLEGGASYDANYNVGPGLRHPPFAAVSRNAHDRAR